MLQHTNNNSNGCKKKNQEPRCFSVHNLHCGSICVCGTRWAQVILNYCCDVLFSSPVVHHLQFHLCLFVGFEFHESLHEGHGHVEVADLSRLIHARDDAVCCHTFSLPGRIWRIPSDLVTTIVQRVTNACSIPVPVAPANENCISCNVKGGPIW